MVVFDLVQEARDVTALDVEKRAIPPRRIDVRLDEAGDLAFAAQPLGLDVALEPLIRGVGEGLRLERNREALLSRLKLG